MIRQGLAGKRILVTGVTGFLGAALFERLLVDIPVERLDVVARGDAAQRVNELLHSSVFAPARGRMGAALDELAQRKVRALSADLASGAPDVSDDVDLVIHAAATVSFDPPIDEAFATNLLGSLNLYEAAGGRPFVHVSTAYVAGLTKGTQKEELLERDIDWRAEADAAMRMRAHVEDASRSPGVLQELESKARDDMGRVGPQATARRAEELRQEWIRTRLIDHGRARARSLGWPDVYTFSKALTEIALDSTAGQNALTIVRPSIIESALNHPHPGWIEGFRMAEPIILAFGRGALPDFTGIRDGVVDIIPVDLVVNGVIAAAAHADRRRAVYHISSGARSPLLFRELYEITRDYFLAHPLPERGRGAYRVPEWSFAGRRAVDKKLATAERIIRNAEGVVARLPRNRFARESARRVDRLRARLDFAKRYAGLYGPYAEMEVVYTDDKAHALWASLPADERRDFPFDTSSFDWRHYLYDVHLPAVTLPVRWMSGTSRPKPKVTIDGNGSAGKVLAVFDVEGTIVASNVVEPFLWLRLSEIEGLGRLRELAAVARRAPSLLRDERRDRGEFLRRFYRLYEGARADRVRELADEVLGDLVLRRLSADAVRRIRAHRAAGHRVVFVSASLDFVIKPIARLADDVVTATLREVDGRYTGDHERAPLVGEGRASWLRDYAEAHGADLQASYAYADSMTDLPLLEAAGKPVAVNPEVNLARIARKRQWPVEEWETGSGAPKVMIPARLP
jgi:HAD superfamily hydrolase (TIGR01490 family)